MNILILDQSELYSEKLKSMILEEERIFDYFKSIAIYQAFSLEEAKTKLVQINIDVLITEVEFSDGAILDFLQEVTEFKKGLGFKIIVCGSIEERIVQLSQESKTFSIFKYLTKPVEEIDLFHLFRELKYYLNNEYSPLKLYFNQEDFNENEIAESIAYLSELYRSVGGDRLIIDTIDLYEPKNILEPLLS